MLQLSIKEFRNLKSQFVTSSWGGRRKMPFAFTEHGTVMLASVLRSKRAIQINIEVVKAFIQLRHVINSKKDITKQLSEIKSFMLKQSNKTNLEFKKVWKAFDELIRSSDDDSKESIGFRA